MHTPTEKTSSSRLPGTAPFLHAATGLGLYLLTLSVEVLLGAGVRWLLTFLAAATIAALIPLGLSAETLAWGAALLPLAHSLLALVMPGGGRIWRRRLGARRPSAEEKMRIDDAFGLLRSVDSRLEPPPATYVLDAPLPAAAVRGRALLLTRALVDSESLHAVLAHELGHLRSLDGRLTEALDRLVIWDDPLSPGEGSGGEVHADVERAHHGGFLWTCLRWTLRLAGGGAGHLLFAPLWAPYWRTRESAADLHAASLGLSEDLAQHLADYELPVDAPRPSLPFNRSEHPPVAHRIERLLAAGYEVSK